MSIEKYYIVKISPVAMESFKGIISYIRNDLKNVAASIKLYDEFEKFMSRIAKFPYSCSKISHKTDKDYRKFFIGNYIVIYHVEEEMNIIVISVFRYASTSLGDSI